MRQWNRVAIVGVGLIGASIGLGLRRRGLAREVVGIGRREASLRVARESGAVTRTTLDLAEGVARAELVVACTPVERIAEIVRGTAAACPRDCLITDAGSTKSAIVAELEATLDPAIRFVGSHPLAGSEKQGPDAAAADLFVDRVVVLTPTERTRANDCAAVSDFWSSLGARVVTMTPEEHDQMVALTSHLPHVVAAALAASVPTSAFALAAGGFRDTTRVAAGDAELWTQILLTNKDNILQAIDAFEGSLAQLRKALAAQDRGRVNHFLHTAKQQRDALGN